MSRSRSTTKPVAKKILSCQCAIPCPGGLFHAGRQLFESRNEPDYPAKEASLLALMKKQSFTIDEINQAPGGEAFDNFYQGVSFAWFCAALACVGKLNLLNELMALPNEQFAAIDFNAAPSYKNTPYVGVSVAWLCVSLVEQNNPHFLKKLMNLPDDKFSAINFNAAPLHQSNYNLGVSVAWMAGHFACRQGDYNSTECSDLLRKLVKLPNQDFFKIDLNAEKRHEANKNDHVSVFDFMLRVLAFKEDELEKMLEKMLVLERKNLVDLRDSVSVNSLVKNRITKSVYAIFALIQNFKSELNQKVDGVIEGDYFLIFEALQDFFEDDIPTDYMSDAKKVELGKIGLEVRATLAHVFLKEFPEQPFENQLQLHQWENALPIYRFEANLSIARCYQANLNLNPDYSAKMLHHALLAATHAKPTDRLLEYRQFYVRQFFHAENGLYVGSDLPDSAATILDDFEHLIKNAPKEEVAFEISPVRAVLVFKTESRLKDIALQGLYEKLRQMTAERDAALAKINAGQPQALAATVASHGVFSPENKANKQSRSGSSEEPAKRQKIRGT